MSKFTGIELEYLKTQRLGRLATINKPGEPQIAPVGHLLEFLRVDHQK